VKDPTRLQIDLKIAFSILLCSTMLLHAKESLKKMYPVAKNYFGGLLPSHSFSGTLLSKSSFSCTKEQL
jgi:hypothetical protein